MRATINPHSGPLSIEVFDDDGQHVLTWEYQQPETKYDQGFFHCYSADRMSILRENQDTYNHFWTDEVFIEEMEEDAYHEWAESNPVFEADGSDLLTLSSSMLDRPKADGGIL